MKLEQLDPKTREKLEKACEPVVQQILKKYQPSQIEISLAPTVKNGDAVQDDTCEQT